MNLSAFIATLADSAPVRLSRAIEWSHSLYGHAGAYDLATCFRLELKELASIVDARVTIEAAASVCTYSFDVTAGELRAQLESFVGATDAQLLALFEAEGVDAARQRVPLSSDF